MPCFTLTLVKKQTVYNLAEMIAAQYDLGPGEAAVATTWPEINIQASYDNILADESPVAIKYGYSQLSGLRWGRQLLPGDCMEIRLGTQYVSTTGRYFLCEGMDGAQISVELGAI
jgi:hypothetical protein